MTKVIDATALVRAALKVAMDVAEQPGNLKDGIDAIGAIANDPSAVAAIIARVAPAEAIGKAFRALDGSPNVKWFPESWPKSPCDIYAAPVVTVQAMMEGGA